MYDWDICLLHLNNKNSYDVLFIDGSQSHYFIVWKGRSVSERRLRLFSYGIAATHVIVCGKWHVKPDLQSRMSTAKNNLLWLMDGHSCDWPLKTPRASPETRLSEATVIHCPGGQQESKYVVISSAYKIALAWQKTALLSNSPLTIIREVLLQTQIPHCSL